MIELKKLEEIRKFIHSGTMRLVYFSRPACGVCTALLPKVKEMLREYPEIESAYINMDLIPESAGEYSILTIPGLLVFAEGREVIREARYISLDELSPRIQRYYSMVFGGDSV